MGKTAFIFPGQGAQYVGMAKDFYDALPVSRNVFEAASAASGLNVEELCFTENEELNITEYTQTAMLAAEVAILKALEEKGCKPDVTAGLSLGEYAALVASGVLTMEDAFKVVRKRGIYMQKAVPNGGAMVAVLGLDTAVIEEVLAGIEGQISIANYNCPGQIVITGEEAAAAEASEKLKVAGAKRCLTLNVSGPFHSPMLVGAGEKLGEVLDTVEIHDITVPYLTNVTADYVTDKSQVKELLMKQVSSSVRWQQTIERMIADGVDTFVEIGPGRTLSGFMKKIDPTKRMLHLEKLEELDQVVAQLQA